MLRRPLAQRSALKCCMLESGLHSLVNADFSSDDSVNEILGAWQAHVAQEPTLGDPVVRELPIEPKRAGFAQQFATLFDRHVVKLLPRDPLAFVLLTVLCCVEINTQGLFFADSLRSDNQAEPMTKIAWGALVGFLPLGIISLYTMILGTERIRVRREIVNGMYNPNAYAIVQLIVHIMLSFTIGSFPNLVSYAWADGEWRAIWRSWLTLSAICFFFIQLGLILGWLLGPEEGGNWWLLVWGLGFVTSGFVIAGDEQPWPIRILYHLSPFNYAFRNFAYAILYGQEWAGTQKCNFDEATGFCPDGFFCPNTTFGEPCLGHTQEQVRLSLPMRYDLAPAHHPHPNAELTRSIFHRCRCSAPSARPVRLSSTLTPMTSSA